MNRSYTRSVRNTQSELLKRIILFTFVAVLLLLAVVFLVPKRTAAAKDTPAGTYQIISVEIEAGDTLWSIANEYFTEDFDSIPSYISEIKRMNGISSDTLYAGAYLLVPCYQ